MRKKKRAKPCSYEDFSRQIKGAPAARRKAIREAQAKMKRRFRKK